MQTIDIAELVAFSIYAFGCSVRGEGHQIGNNFNVHIQIEQLDKNHFRSSVNRIYYIYFLARE